MVIVFSLQTALSRVAAAGGVPTPVTKPAKEEVHRFRNFCLAANVSFLVSAGSKSDVTVLRRLAGRTSAVRILQTISKASYVAPDDSAKTGYSCFRRETTLMPAFDPDRLAMSARCFRWPNK